MTGLPAAPVRWPRGVGRLVRALRDDGAALKIAVEHQIGTGMVRHLARRVEERRIEVEIEMRDRRR